MQITDKQKERIYPFITDIYALLYLEDLILLLFYWVFMDHCTVKVPAEGQGITLTDLNDFFDKI